MLVRIILFINKGYIWIQQGIVCYIAEVTFKHYTFKNLRIDILASVLFSTSLIDKNKNTIAS